MDILTKEQLLLDIQAELDKAMESQIERLTEVATSDLPIVEKQAEMAKIATEKYSAQAILSQLKPVVTYNGKVYSMPVIVKTRQSSIGSTGKAPSNFVPGDLIKLVDKGKESSLYEVQVDGQLKDETGEIIRAGEAVLRFKLDCSGETKEEFLTRYLTENNREFKGYAGLTYSQWHKNN